VISAAKLDITFHHAPSPSHSMKSTSTLPLRDAMKKRRRKKPYQRTKKTTQAGIGHPLLHSAPSSSQQAIDTSSGPSFVDTLAPFIKRQFEAATPHQKDTITDRRSLEEYVALYRGSNEVPLEERVCERGLPRYLCSYCLGLIRDCYLPSHDALVSFHDI